MNPTGRAADRATATVQSFFFIISCLPCSSGMRSMPRAAHERKLAVAAAMAHDRARYHATQSRAQAGYSPRRGRT
jgi:hypothetical protein